jgi:hypothetical protein
MRVCAGTVSAGRCAPDPNSGTPKFAFSNIDGGHRNDQTNYRFPYSPIRTRVITFHRVHFRQLRVYCSSRRQMSTARPGANSLMISRAPPTAGSLRLQRWVSGTPTRWGCHGRNMQPFTNAGDRGDEHDVMRPVTRFRYVRNNAMKSVAAFLKCYPYRLPKNRCMA